MQRLLVLELRQEARVRKGARQVGPAQRRRVVAVVRGVGRVQRVVAGRLADLARVVRVLAGVGQHGGRRWRRRDHRAAGAAAATKMGLTSGRPGGRRRLEHRVKVASAGRAVVVSVGVAVSARPVVVRVRAGRLRAVVCSPSATAVVGVHQLLLLLLLWLLLLWVVVRLLVLLGGHRRCRHQLVLVANRGGGYIR